LCRHPNPSRCGATAPGAASGWCSSHLFYCWPGLLITSSHASTTNRTWKEQRHRGINVQV
jgi:hypothetical protein